MVAAITRRLKKLSAVGPFGSWTRHEAQKHKKEHPSGEYDHVLSVP
jgi:hypothetical protein